jgi:hypothetical protein
MEIQAESTAAEQKKKRAFAALGNPLVRPFGPSGDTDAFG